MTKNTALTAQSQNLLDELVNSEEDWGGTPLYNERDRTQAENGNLTDLKVKGLLFTFTERENGTDLIWVEITEAGHAAATK